MIIFLSQNSLNIHATRCHYNNYTTHSRTSAFHNNPLRKIGKNNSNENILLLQSDIINY